MIKWREKSVNSVIKTRVENREAITNSMQEKDNGRNCITEEQKRDIK